MEKERTLILIKPDGVVRGIIGRIISRFEDSGLKLIAMKMIWADEALAKKHYHLDEEWMKQAFEKTRVTAEKEGRVMEFKDPLHLGTTLQKWNMEFLCENPVVAIILEGYHAIELARKIVGSTEPKQSPPGTIRGDFASVESYAVANKKKRVLRNLIHASDSVPNAEREISLWFSKSDIHNYKKSFDI